MKRDLTHGPRGFLVLCLFVLSIFAAIIKFESTPFSAMERLDGAPKSAIELVVDHNPDLAPFSLKTQTAPEHTPACATVSANKPFIHAQSGYNTLVHLRLKSCGQLFASHKQAISSPYTITIHHTSPTEDPLTDA